MTEMGPCTAGGIFLVLRPSARPGAFREISAEKLDQIAAVISEFTHPQQVNNV